MVDSPNALFQRAGDEALGAGAAAECRIDPSCAPVTMPKTCELAGREMAAVRVGRGTMTSFLLSSPRVLMATPVLVTGATGRIGRLVVDELLGAGVPVRALTRRPEAARLPAGAEVVTGDFTVPESLDAGLRGVSTVFLVWTAPPATTQAVVERIAAHTERVVFLSSPHRTPHPFFQQPNPMAVLHTDIERLIAANDLASTIIRPGMFSSNTLHWWAASIRSHGVVRWPYAAAETAPIDERDIAAVAARALREARHAGGDYVLTGPESLSQSTQVSIIAEAIGRPIHFEELSPDAFRIETTGSWPRPVVDMLLAAWGATMGRPALVTSTVSDILGSPPRTFRQWATDHASAFVGERSY